MTLKPEEIRFWEMAFCARFSRGCSTSWAAKAADEAIEHRRERIQRDVHDPGAGEMR